MNLIQVGLVGLPNVGKSTLFNALTQTRAAMAANYPFCTIDPNIQEIDIPDATLIKLAEVAGSAKIIHSKMSFVDIAGLVKGASQGAGLGNRFLGHIRQVDAIAFVLRCFEDDEITHVEGRVNPLEDAEIIRLELVFADIENLEKRRQNMEKKAKQDKEIARRVQVIEELLLLLNRDAGRDALVKLVESDKFSQEERMYIQKELNLLSLKPYIYISNVEEASVASGNSLAAQVTQMAQQENVENLIISAKIEEEIANLPHQSEKAAFIAACGLEQSGLEQIILAAYRMLKLNTYYTVGPKEAHAWLIRQGTLAPQAAGVIHSDFERGFISAEVISAQDFIELRGAAKARELGKMRLEGRKYIMQNGDIALFKFNV